MLDNIATDSNSTMSDPEAVRRTERTGTLKSLRSILTPPKIKIKRKHLSKYSWLPDVFRYDGSVIRYIAGPVLTVTIFASIIAYLDTQGKRINLTNNVVPLLSVVVGLILVFRNSTSYERWNEGRKDFGIMMSSVRNLSRNIWTVVQLPPEQSEAAARYMKSLPKRTIQHPLFSRQMPGSSSPSAQHDAIAQNLGVAHHFRGEKIRVLKLLIAYVIAAKHHLRGEPGLDYDDLAGLLPPELYRDEASGWERTIVASPDRTSAATVLDPNTRIKSRARPMSKPTATTPLLTDSLQNVEYHAYHERKHMPLPLIIAHEVTRALYRFKRYSCLEVVGYAMHNGMQSLVQAMVDQLTAMERVSNTPIPASYAIHLKQCVTLYLFALPFILVHDLGLTMIPVVTVVAFTLMGIEGIADEIEHPFGDDPNDHPLDKLCAELRDEIMFMIERLPEGVEDSSEDPVFG